MDINTKTGTICGTVMVLLFKVSSEELLTTGVLAVVGATVSFLVSLFWRHVLKRWK